MQTYARNSEYCSKTMHYDTAAIIFPGFETVLLGPSRK